MPNEYTRTQTEAQGRPRATLSTIIAATRSGLGALRDRAKELEAAALSAATPPAWRDAFGGWEVTVIGEVKRRSPSAGEIAGSLDPALYAAAYARGGGRAISVLTEGPHFGGSLDDLVAVRGAVALPVLRKDFIIDPVQVFESRARGASAILLIARGLHRGELRALAQLAREVGLATLVEIHRASELDAALATEPDAVGVNSRDLETFRVDVGIVEELLREIPAGTIAVAESGLHSRSDVERVASWGADAVLVGTTLASAVDPEAAVRALAGCPRNTAARSAG
ncbi:MAG: indole-3-glycerol-phosphate synthase [Gemmatimonadetes bacterium]|nr:indole-3-glycerol-phosphate synthase [Gemmatimonadota bacterium]